MLNHNCCTPQSKGEVICNQCHGLSKGVLGKTVEYLLNDEANPDVHIHENIYKTIPNAKYISYTMPPYATAYSLKHGKKYLYLGKFL
jgi:ribulose-5-phosphate 4-epimerase/fuculose-1-phosphate aldolase